MKRILSIIVLAMCLVFPGCDIWEDRSACPKILAVDCSLLEGKALDADIWIFGPDGSLFSRTRISEHEFYKEQTYYVQTGNYKCYVWANLGAGTVTSDINTLSGKLLKAASIEADPLFAYLATEKPFTGFGKGLKNAALKKFADLNNKAFGDKAYIKWNFTKFLVDRQGKVIARFEPTEDMQAVRAAVAAAL